MQRSSNETFLTPPLKVNLQEDGNTKVTSDYAPGKEWVHEEAEIATLNARRDLDQMFKEGTLGNSIPKWAEEFGAKPKGSEPW